MVNSGVENLVIIGSGPAGYTAAIYGARANLKPFMFEGYQVGGLPGGQLMTTTEVENFPGFPDGITGPELMDQMKAQALRWGTEMVTEDVTAVDISQRPFIIGSEERVVRAHSIVIATGATAKRLGLPSEQKFWNQGISACAICDGATPIFRQEELAVIGGGDSAAEEAVYLTKYGSHVHLLVRSGQMRASKAMQDRVLKNPKITVHWHTEVMDGFGDSQLAGITILNRKTGEKTDLPVKGLFYAIGHTPNTQLFQGQLDLTPAGYIATQTNSTATSVAGIFAAGDVQDHEFRQAVTAAGTGCMAAILAERWLSSQDLITEFHQTAASEKPEDDSKPAEYQQAAAFDPDTTRHQGGYALRKLFHESDRPLVVKYAAPTCGPCHMLGPILSKVIDQFEGQVHYIEIDITEDPEIAEMGGVTGTPTVQIFKTKDLVTELRGVKPKSQYHSEIEALL